MNFFTDNQGRVQSVLTASYGYPPGGRLTLASGGQPCAADVAAAASVYYTPYRGNRISLWNGYAWQTLTFAELTLAGTSVASTGLRMATTGNTTVNTTTITGIPSTTGLAVGDFVDSANFPNGTWVSAVNSATQVTVTANATATTTGVAIRFYAQLYDVYGYFDPNNGLVLTTLPWASRSARATNISFSDGFYVNTNDKTRLYLGTLGLASASQSGSNTMYDTQYARQLYNYYNRVRRRAWCSDFSPHTYGTASFRPWNNGSVAAGNYWNISTVVGVAEDSMVYTLMADMNGATTGDLPDIGVGLDSTTGVFFDMFYQYYRERASRVFNTSVGPGYHVYYVLETMASGTSANFNGMELSIDLWI